jgi:two-component system, NarL family, invasion response regulator UvrY
MTADIKVQLVDDHAVVREGYRRLLERGHGITVCCESAEPEQAYIDFCVHQPDVVVVDIGLPGSSGIELTRRLLARDPAARVLIFSMHDEGIFVSKALDAGAIGYVTKASAPEVLVEALHTVAAGRRYLSQDAMKSLAGTISDDEAEAVRSLSPKEFEILTMLTQGRSHEFIAERLHLSAKTVANLQSLIRQKLGVANSAQLIRIAARCGIAVLE